MAHKDAGADFDDFDEFGDDAFADVSPDQLQNLEQQAMLATQQSAPPPIRPTPTISRHNAPAPVNSRLGLGGGAYSFNQNFQEDVINLDDYPRSNFGGATQNASFAGHLGNTGNRRQLTRVDSRNGSVLSSNSMPVRSREPSSQANVSDLLDRIKKLEQEKVTLRRNAESATAAIQAKTGEASIIRQKFEKSTRDYEHRLQELRQTHAEALLKQESRLETLRNERQKVETDNQFLKHDLVLEAGKAKAVQRAKSGASAKGVTAEKMLTSTPKRQTRSFGDGFEGGASIAWSPSKPRDGSKPVTPNQRPEKKRKRDDSNPFLTSELPVVGTRGDNTPAPIFSPYSSRSAIEADDDTGLSFDTRDEKTELLQDILDHKVPNSEDRLIEALATFSLPSVPNSKLSRTVMDKITAVPSKASVQDLAGAICGALHELWQSCLDDKFYEPLEFLVDAIQFTLRTQPFSFSRTLISTLVPLCTRTVELVALPVTHAAYHAQKGLPPNPAHTPPEIEVTLCLDLLYALATACQRSKEHIKEFWSVQVLNCHFVLVMLFKAQPMDQISSMVKLLRMSTLSTSFGVIVGDAIDPGIGTQEDIETHIIDRLTNLLFEYPPPPTTNDTPDIDDLLTFRNDIITTLKKMCMSPYSASALATHRFAIGRFIRFIHESIDSLYLPHTSQASTHSLVVWGINTATQLLKFLLTKFADKVDIREKLRAEEGGAQMHLIALTRLAFCEPVLLEAGIDSETSDAAHELLDVFLSPVEGEQLLAMYASVDGTVATAMGHADEHDDQDEHMDDDSTVHTREFSASEAARAMEIVEMEE